MSAYLNISVAFALLLSSNFKFLERQWKLDSVNDYAHHILHTLETVLISV